MKTSPIISGDNKDDRFESVLNKEEKSLQKNWEGFVNHGCLLHEQDLSEKVNYERESLESQIEVLTADTETRAENIKTLIALSKKLILIESDPEKYFRKQHIQEAARVVHEYWQRRLSIEAVDSDVDSTAESSS